MKLNFEFVCKQLEKHYPLTMAIPEAMKEDEYYLPLQYVDGKHYLSPKKFYIIRPEDWDFIHNSGEDTAVISIGPPPATYCGLAAWVDAPCDFIQLYQEVINIYAQADKFVNACQEAQNSTEALHMILEQIATYTPNAIQVTDSDYRVVDGFASGDVPPEFYAVIGEKIALDALQDSTTYPLTQGNRGFFFPDQPFFGSKADVYTILIRQQNLRYYCLTISANNKPIDIVDKTAAQMALPYLQNVLFGLKLMTSMYSFMLDRVFRSLITDHIAGDVQGVGQYAQWLSLDVLEKNAARLLCFVCQLQADTIFPISYFCSRAVNILRSYAPVSFATVFPFGTSLVGFAMLDEYDGTEKQLFDAEFLGLLEYFNMKMGVSSFYTNIRDSKHSYEQALSALGISVLKKATPTVLVFRDIALSYILNYGDAKLPRRFLCIPELLDLKEKDKLNNTEYIKTIVAYYENGMNSSLTAKVLHVHRSTFLYRIEHIQKSLNMDLDDVDHMLWIIISLKYMGDMSDDAFL